MYRPPPPPPEDLLAIITKTDFSPRKVRLSSSIFTKYGNCSVCNKFPHIAIVILEEGEWGGGGWSVHRLEVFCHHTSNTCVYTVLFITMEQKRANIFPMNAKEGCVVSARIVVTCSHLTWFYRICCHRSHNRNWTPFLVMGWFHRNNQMRYFFPLLLLLAHYNFARFLR